MTAQPARLPRDLQGRLDVILAKPVLRRCPSLQQAIEVLVRNAYERRPGPPVIAMTDELAGITAGQARGILDQFAPDQDGVL